MLHEPLIHFTALAMALFVVHAFLFSDEREIILVGQATQTGLVSQRSELLARKLTEQETKQVIEDYIEREILVREAQKQGLDNTSRIKDLMVRNMRVRIRGDSREPSDVQLRDHFKKYIARFSSPRRLEMELITLADTPATSILDQLNAGLASEDGNEFKTKSLLVTERRLIGVFGKDLAERILKIDNGRWHGPFESGETNYFLRIKGRTQPQTPNFEEAVNLVKRDWLAERERENMAGEINKFRQKYHVIIRGENDEQ